MHGKTCAGLWVTGTGKDGNPRVDVPVSRRGQPMVDGASTAPRVVWQTAVNPVVALELLATGIWSGTGVLGPEAFDSSRSWSC